MKEKIRGRNGEKRSYRESTGGQMKKGRKGKNKRE